MISLRIRGTDRAFTNASAQMDLASNSTQATITYRLPSGTAWDTPMDEIVLGENPVLTEYGVATEFDDSTLLTTGTARWASTARNQGVYAPAPGLAVAKYTTRTSLLPTDTLYA